MIERWIPKPLAVTAEFLLSFQNIGVIMFVTNFDHINGVIMFAVFMCTEKGINWAAGLPFDFGLTKSRCSINTLSPINTL